MYRRRRVRALVPATLFALALALYACGPGSADDRVSTTIDTPLPENYKEGPDEPLPDQTPGDPGGPYPLVLVHGLFGFEKIGELSYFYQVKPTLEAEGHRVFIASLDPINDSEARGAQLVAFVDEVLGRTGAAKVNLIGHSQGGIDVRYAAHERADRVGAVVTIGAPHGGAHLADVVLKVVPGPTLVASMALFTMLGKLFAGELAAGSDIEAALAQLSTEGMSAFNAKYPDQPAVRYFSIGGRSGTLPADEDCAAPDAPPFISRYEMDVDALDPTLSLVSWIVGGSLYANDGIVQVRKMKWGTWLGCVPADHYDEVGQIADAPDAGNGFDHRELYKDLARYLVEKGF